MIKKRRPTTINHLSVALMMRAFMDGPVTSQELAHECGLSIVTCRRYIAALKNAKVIHIKLWDVDAYGRRSCASYALGDSPNAKRNPKSSAEREAARRERLRQANRTKRINGLVMPCVEQRV